MSNTLTAEEYIPFWIEKNQFEYDNFPFEKCMEDYANYLHKAKVESDKKLLAEAIEIIKYYSNSGKTKKVKNGIIEYDVDAGALYDYKEIPMTDNGQKANEFLQKLLEQ